LTAVLILVAIVALAAVLVGLPVWLLWTNPDTEIPGKDVKHG
jgi:flagellar basal body-associated protein FliL